MCRSAVIGLPGVGSVYSESLSTSGHASGTSGSPITFIAQGRVVVSAPGDVRALLQNRSYWTWKYFIFEGPSIASTQLAYVQSAATVVFDYCTFRNTPLMTSGGRAVLAYASTVYFYNDVITENQLSGLELQNSSTVVMRNSVVAGNVRNPLYYGVVVQSGSTFDADYSIFAGNRPASGNNINGSWTDGGHNTVTAGPMFRSHRFGVATISYCQDDGDFTHMTAAGTALVALGLRGTFVIPIRGRRPGAPLNHPGIL